MMGHLCNLQGAVSLISLLLCVALKCTDAVLALIMFFPLISNTILHYNISMQFRIPMVVGISWHMCTYLSSIASIEGKRLPRMQARSPSFSGEKFCSCEQQMQRLAPSSFHLLAIHCFVPSKKFLTPTQLFWRLLQVVCLRRYSDGRCIKHPSWVP